jgi:peroxiredoxin
MLRLLPAVSPKPVAAVEDGTRRLRRFIVPSAIDRAPSSVAADVNRRTNSPRIQLALTALFLASAALPVVAADVSPAPTASSRGRLALSSPGDSDPFLLDSSKSSKVENFILRDHQGDSRELYRQDTARAVVLIFTITGCPIVQKSLPKIEALRKQFASKGVVFWLVNSNPHDDADAIRAEARDFAIHLPILLDHSQSLARSLDASRTAEAFCIETKSWTVFYRGAIDDRLGYGAEKPKASHAYLESALKSFLAGKAVAPARTDVKGCLIQFEKPAEKK